MKSFFSRVAKASSDIGNTSGSTTASVFQGYYSLSSFRWHMDNRPPVKAVLLHDLFSSSHAWKQSLHEYVGSMPRRNLSPTDPLEVYCPDLRGHGFSDAMQVEPNTLVAATVKDLFSLQEVIIGGKCCLGGTGFGAMVACQGALHSPEKISSLALFVEDLQSLHVCAPGKYPQQKIIKSLQEDTESLTALNQKLLNEVPRLDERAVLLLNTKKTNTDSKLVFRVHDAITKYDGFFRGVDWGKSVFNGPTSVFHTATLNQEEKLSFQKNFPQSTFSQVKEGGVLYPGSAKLAPLVLNSFNILGQMSKETE